MVGAIAFNLPSFEICPFLSTGGNLFLFHIFQLFFVVNILWTLLSLVFIFAAYASASNAFGKCLVEWKYGYAIMDVVALGTLFCQAPVVLRFCLALGYSWALRQGTKLYAIKRSRDSVWKFYDRLSLVCPLAVVIVSSWTVMWNVLSLGIVCSVAFAPLFIFLFFVWNFLLGALKKIHIWVVPVVQEEKERIAAVRLQRLYRKVYLSTVVPQVRKKITLVNLSRILRKIFYEMTFFAEDVFDSVWEETLPNMVYFISTRYKAAFLGDGEKNGGVDTAKTSLLSDIGGSDVSRQNSNKGRSRSSNKDHTRALSLMAFSVSCCPMVVFGTWLAAEAYSGRGNTDALVKDMYNFFFAVFYDLEFTLLITLDLSALNFEEAFQSLQELLSDDPLNFLKASDTVVAATFLTSIIKVFYVLALTVLKTSTLMNVRTVLLSKAADTNLESKADRKKLQTQGSVLNPNAGGTPKAGARFMNAISMMWRYDRAQSADSGPNNGLEAAQLQQSRDFNKSSSDHDNGALLSNASDSQNESFEGNHGDCIYGVLDDSQNKSFEGDHGDYMHSVLDDPISASPSSVVLDNATKESRDK
jgi:hypothetical protein